MHTVWIVSAGASADFVKTRLEGHRSYLLSFVSFLFIISQIVGSQVENVNHLWLASLLLGLGHGGIFGLLPTVRLTRVFSPSLDDAFLSSDNTRVVWYGCVYTHRSDHHHAHILPYFIEYFLLAHFSENWGFVSLAPLIGGNLFSILFGRNIDAHVISASTDPKPITEAALPRAPGPGGQCLEGRVCYASTMTVTTFACLLALILSLVAAWRDRRKKESIENEYVSLPQVIWEDEAEE